MNLLPPNKKDIKKRANAFFQGKNWNKALVFLNFVALAFVFWLSQHYQQTYEVEKTVPLSYINVPPDVLLSADNPEHITVKLSDKGTAFITYGITRRNDSIQISLANIDIDTTSYTINQSMLSSAIRTYLFSTTSLVSFFPNNIQVGYSPLVSKEVPVRLNGEITPAQGYILVDSIQMQPSKVMVYSDAATLDTLQSIPTAYTKQTNIKKSLKKEVKLQIPPGVKLSESKTEINVNVEEYTEKSLLIPITCINIPADIKVRLFPSEVEVLCYLPLRLYSQLTENDLEIKINYKQLMEESDNSTTISLSKKPDYLINYRIVPEKIEFLLESN